MAATKYLCDVRAGKGFSADYHRQYLAKDPDGYCGIGGCGVHFKLAQVQVGRRRSRGFGNGTFIEPEGYRLSKSKNHAFLHENAS